MHFVPWSLPPCLHHFLPSIVESKPVSHPNASPSSSPQRWTQLCRRLCWCNRETQESPVSPMSAGILWSCYVEVRGLRTSKSTVRGQAPCPLRCLQTPSTKSPPLDPLLLESRVLSHTPLGNPDAKYQPFSWFPYNNPLLLSTTSHNPLTPI